MKPNQPPVTLGQTAELEISGLNHSGEGVGKIGGYTVFVPFSAPGEKVRGKVISVQKNYARALLEEIVQPSPGRTESPCTHYEQCGGCSLQHLSYGEQLHWKREIVREALRRLGGLETHVRPVLGMEEPWRYRNKAQFPLVMEGKELKAGFFRRGSHRVVNLEHCPIQLPAAEAVLQAARDLIMETETTVYDAKTHRGLLRHLVIRSSVSGEQLMVILVTNGCHFPRGDYFAGALTAAVPAITGVVQNVNTRRGNVIMGTVNVLLWGELYLEETIGGITFLISPGSFFQVNTAQAGVLFQQVENLAALTGSETVFDLYCGTGTIALYLSRKAGKVVGIESFSPAVEDARKNARINGITNTEFHKGPAEELFPQLLKQGYSPDVVIVDPPRKGCTGELLSTVASAKPKRLIYVSCNPTTLARDLRHLQERGYLPSEVQPVDMFPHTSHVETVVLMSKVKD